MAKLEFTRKEFEYLKENLMLNDEMAQILEMKIKGESITKMALELNTSESTISRRISELKRKIKRIL
jgi:DNA-binding NarL/FixJ family response regulator